MQTLVKRITKELPKFNDKVLTGIRKKETAELIEFISARYRECAAAISPNLFLLGYEILPPVERLKAELAAKPKRNVINIRGDEAILVEFKFRFDDTTFTNQLYVPYIYEDSTFVIGGTRCECQLSVTEKIFSVRTRTNGVTIKVIRSPISFWKNTIHIFYEINTEVQHVGHVVTCKIHGKKSSVNKKKLQPTAVHYLLCKHPLPDVLKMFGFDGDSITFCQKPSKYAEDRYYFKAQNLAINRDPVLMSVNKELFDEQRVFADIVSTISYVMCGFRSIDLVDLLTSSVTTFRILLGKILYSSSAGIDRVHALSYMDKHIESIDLYVDSYTKDIMKMNGMAVNDIYELLVFLVQSIDGIVLASPNNNMYNKRIETINNVIADHLISTLYYRIYSKEKKSNTRYMNDVSIDVFNVNPKLILKTLRNSENVRFNPSIYSDNWLLSVGDKVVKRLSATSKPKNIPGAKSPIVKKSTGSAINSPANRYHPSMIEIESALGFSSNPGVNVLINPYAKVDDGNGFMKNEYGSELADLYRYLPK